MQKYKIVASDLDGTLFNNSSQISEENMRAIAELAKRDVCFVPSTGRGFSELPEELKNNPNIRYLICSNGAVVFDKKTGHSIMSCISRDISNQVLDIVTACDTHISIRYDGKLILDKTCQTDEKYDYYDICQPHREVILNSALLLDDFEKTVRSFDNVEVIAVVFKNRDEQMACRKILEQHDEIRVVEAFDNLLEIFSADAGKGNALYALADMLGVSYDETISVGDSDNDASIVQTAGLGLAVANACDLLKEVADEVICSNEEHAIEYILSHYFI